ncbi:MAG TPA: SGNH/GDSL hydrolase family protein [Polyangiaceae bacterium]|nr:SGNH/GDSL hydrolase family protein [Polyangiaceae bacterium]
MRGPELVPVALRLPRISGLISGLASALTLTLASGLGVVGCAERAGLDAGPDGASDEAASGGAGGDAAGAGGDTSQPSVVSDEPPGLQYFGRWEVGEDGSARGSWGALYFRARFEGTSVALLLDDSGNDFQYRIDGGEFTRLSADGSGRYPLASDLGEGPHHLEVYRRTGGSFGLTVVHGLELDPGAELLPPFVRQERRIEIVGDSISVGFGNEGQGGTSRDTENGYEAYGPQLARLLHADWSVVAHSGQGLFRNLGEEKAAAASSLHMPDEFLLSYFPGTASPNPAWDHTRWEPDVFVVTLGTNDFSWKVWNEDPGPDWEPTEEEFGGAAREFLGLVRDKYPSTEIFAVGTFLANSTNQFGRANEYLCRAVEALDDAHAHCIDPSSTGPDGAWLSSGTQFIGDWTHPTVEGHRIIAEHLRDWIELTLEWSEPTQ